MTIVNNFQVLANKLKHPVAQLSLPMHSVDIHYVKLYNLGFGVIQFSCVYVSHLGR